MTTQIINLLTPQKMTYSTEDGTQIAFSSAGKNKVRVTVGKKRGKSYDVGSLRQQITAAKAICRQIWGDQWAPYTSDAILAIAGRFSTEEV